MVKDISFSIWIKEVKYYPQSNDFRVIIENPQKPSKKEKTPPLRGV